MAHYSIRDLLGHFVKVPPDSNEEGMCPHPCCRGKRVHPDRFPLMLPKGVLRTASDPELVRHFEKDTVGNDPKAAAQVVKELDRRERKRGLDLRSDREKRADHRAVRAEEYRIHLEHEFITAEAATRGTMVNKRGRAKGVDPRAFWGNKSLRDRYASDELRAWFDRHPPISAREFTGGAAAQSSGARRRRSTQLYGVY